MRKWIRRISCVLLTLMVLALLGGFTYEQVGRARDASQLPPRVGQAVDIGGRTLNLYCSGQGTPTVILETGGNSPGYEWLLLQSKMAVFTRACWYDRAGVGWSDPPSSPRTSASIVSDLHEALHRAGVLPPYVMAGGSVGGEYVHIYTARYPSDVAGLVLIDSSVPDMHEPDFVLSPAKSYVGQHETPDLYGPASNGAIRRASFRGEQRAAPSSARFHPRASQRIGEARSTAEGV